MGANHTKKKQQAKRSRSKSKKLRDYDATAMNATRQEKQQASEEHKQIKQTFDKRTLQRQKYEVEKKGQREEREAVNKKRIEEIELIQKKTNEVLREYEQSLSQQRESLLLAENAIREITMRLNKMEKQQVLLEKEGPEKSLDQGIEARSQPTFEDYGDRNKKLPQPLDEEQHESEKMPLPHTDNPENAIKSKPMSKFSSDWKQQDSIGSDLITKEIDSSMWCKTTKTNLLTWCSVFHDPHSLDVDLPSESEKIQISPLLTRVAAFHRQEDNPILRKLD